MRGSRIYPPDVQAAAHVFQPLVPASGMEPGPLTDLPDWSEPAQETVTRQDYPPSDAERVGREAYEKGLKDGKTLTEQEMTTAAHALAEAVGRYRAELENSKEELKRDGLSLCLAVARQVVMRELQADPDAIGGIISKLLDSAEGREVAAIQLHPDDVRRVKQAEAGRVLEQAGIAIRPSEEITPGGCVIETGFGKLDARVETRLEEIAAGLLSHAAGSADGTPKSSG